MAVQVDSLTSHAPIACEAAHFVVACFLIAVEIAVVVRLVGSVAPVAVEAVVAVALAVVAAALAAAVEASADYFGTDPEQNQPIQHTDLPVGRKSARKKRQGKAPSNTTS